jgi:DNA-directed RNA polymerase subunit omega
LRRREKERGRENRNARSALRCRLTGGPLAAARKAARPAIGRTATKGNFFTGFSNPRVLALAVPAGYKRSDRKRGTDMARITVEDCLEKIPNRFELVLLASKRAKLLLKGARPLVETDNKDIVTSLREVGAGKVRMVYPK